MKIKNNWRKSGILMFTPPRYDIYSDHCLEFLSDSHEKHEKYLALQKEYFNAMKIFIDRVFDCRQGQIANKIIQGQYIHKLPHLITAKTDVFNKIIKEILPLVKEDSSLVVALMDLSLKGYIAHETAINAEKAKADYENCLTKREFFCYIKEFDDAQALHNSDRQVQIFDSGVFTKGFYSEEQEKKVKDAEEDLEAIERIIKDPSAADSVKERFEKRIKAEKDKHDELKKDLLYNSKRLEEEKKRFAELAKKYGCAKK